MPYRAPLKDFHFLLGNIIGFEQLTATALFADATPETVEAILEIAATCTDSNPDDRPAMSEVLQMLEQEVLSPYPSDFYESQSEYS